MIVEEKILPEKTLIIFDEIQDCFEALMEQYVKVRGHVILRKLDQFKLFCI